MPATRKARPRSSAKPVTPEQIEGAAVRLFSEKTYPAVGMRDISDAVGLLPGSLYVHIKSKEEVLLKIVRDGISNYVDALTPISEADQPAATRLRQLMMKYMEILDGNLELTKVAVFQWRYLTDPGRAGVIELREQYKNLFARVIDDGIAAGEFSTFQQPAIVIAGVIGLLNSTIHWYSPDGPVSASEVGEQVAELVLRAFAQ